MPCHTGATWASARVGHWVGRARGKHEPEPPSNVYQGKARQTFLGLASVNDFSGCWTERLSLGA